MSERLDARPGTYALLLELREACNLEIGRLRRVSFAAGHYIYLGSAFGSGGLRARIGHHLRRTLKPHWHIDALRRKADVVGLWITHDSRRMECNWASAANRFRGAQAVAAFGSTDCRCASHLIFVPALPSRTAFRRHLRDGVPRCSQITELHRPALSAEFAPSLAIHSSGSRP